MKRIVITGANRGLGLAYTTQLLEAGNRVFGTVRVSSNTESLEELKVAYPEQLTIHSADITSSQGIDALFQAIVQETAGLELLFNNAGILTHDQTLESVEHNDLRENFMINAVAPVMLTQKLLPLLKKGSSPIVINISSSFASLNLKNNDMPTRYSYSMSKAALNMFTKTLAGELEADGITVVSIHPGWVRTGIGGPDARFSPEESARAVLQTVEQLTLAQTGKYLAWDGREIGW